MDTFDRLTRQTVAIDSPKEIRTLANSPTGKRAYARYDPSRDLTLDDLVRATKLADFQEVGFEVVIGIADAVPPSATGVIPDDQRADPDRLHAQLLAFGLDEAQTEFVPISSILHDRAYLLEVLRGAAVTSLEHARTLQHTPGGDDTTVGQVLRPLFRAVELAYLDVDVVVAELEQRDFHEFAGEHLPLMGHSTPPVIYIPQLTPLDTGIRQDRKEPELDSGKRYLSVTDSRKAIEKSVMSAFCPPTRDIPSDVAGRKRHNPVLQRFEYLVFPHFETVRIDRPERYGDSVTYSSYRALEVDLEAGTLHPVDAKHALVNFLDELIAPVRDSGNTSDSSG